MNNQFKYPIGECKGIRYWACDERNQKELIGYSWFNIQIVDTEANTVRPSGEREKVPTCLECYLYEKPFMEDRMAEEKIKNPSLIPYQWFWFYNEEDEKKHPNNWERRYEYGK